MRFVHNQALYQNLTANAPLRNFQILKLELEHS